MNFDICLTYISQEAFNTLVLIPIQRTTSGNIVKYENSFTYLVVSKFFLQLTPLTDRSVWISLFIISILVSLFHF